jgi:polyisoprenoid-binding protein YceI
MKRLLILTAVAVLAACSPRADDTSKTAAAPAAAVQPEPITAPAGVYVLDKDHTSVLFRVSHIGMSRYTARFTGVAGKLTFDAANPTAQSVSAVIDARSVQTNYLGPPKLGFDTEVETQFLHADRHPQITFVSTKVEPTGPRAARVTGNLTLNGVTRPVALETTFNGGYPPNDMDPGGRIGFSAHGTFKRSDFGVAYGLPAPGTTMGVGDEVEVIIETEFTKK